jgi:hypothetical protein
MAGHQNKLNALLEIIHVNLQPSKIRTARVCGDDAGGNYLSRHPISPLDTSRTPANGKASQRAPQTQEMAFCVMRRVHDSIWEPTGSSLQSRKAPEATSMSDEDDWEFAGPDDAKADIRAAVEYLLRDATGGARGDVVQEIIAIVRQVASGLPPEQGNNPLDDDMPGG